MEQSVMKHVMNMLFPYMLNLIIFAGIVFVLTGITVGIYSYIKQIDISPKRYFITLGIGALVLLSAILICVIKNFMIYEGKIKSLLPTGYILTMVIFFILYKKQNKEEVSGEQ